MHAVEPQNKGRFGIEQSLCSFFGGSFKLLLISRIYSDIHVYAIIWTLIQT